MVGFAYLLRMVDREKSDSKERRLRGGSSSGSSLEGGTGTNFSLSYDHDLKTLIQNMTQHKVEDWLGFPVVSTCMYGIRVNSDKTLVPPHLLEPSNTISAILNVAQDLNEKWPFELYRRDGSAINITLSPGELLMYESGSIIHGVRICLTTSVQYVILIIS